MSPRSKTSEIVAKLDENLALTREVDLLKRQIEALLEVRHEGRTAREEIKESGLHIETTISWRHVAKGLWWVFVAFNTSSSFHHWMQFFAR